MSRLKKIIDVLTREIDDATQSTSILPILCLQEVSTDWHAQLTTALSPLGYVVEASHYGSSTSGRMGVLTAVPSKSFRLLRSSIQPARALIPTATVIEEAFLASQSSVSMSTSSVFKFETAATPWIQSSVYNNELVLTEVEDQLSKQRFVVSNYHMPCLFQTPLAMVIHAGLFAHCSQQWAGEKPLIMVGDMNFQPGSAAYQLLTTGKLPECDLPAVLPIANAWSPSPLPGGPLSSAYVQLNDVEPDFTNRAASSWGGRVDEFTGTLDYVFLSDHWNVQQVRALPSLSSIDPTDFLPNENEPSDHLLIWVQAALSESSSCARGE